MKILFAAALLLVGSCATLRHSEKIENLKESIAYDDEAVVIEYLNTIKANGGKVNLPTVSGGTLTAMIKGEKVMLKDENGGVSTITAVDLEGTNGIIHVIDTVVLPK